MRNIVIAVLVVALIGGIYLLWPGRKGPQALMARSGRKARQVRLVPRDRRACPVRTVRLAYRDRKGPWVRRVRKVPSAPRGFLDSARSRWRASIRGRRARRPTPARWSGQQARTRA